MFSAVNRSLEAKRARLANDEQGFTLIELLVVVIIIGILAAIAIPVFLGQQDQAKDGAAKSDLGNAKVAYVSNLVDTPDGSAGITGFTKSSNVTSVAVGAGSAGAVFCIQAVSSSTSAPVYSISNTGGVVKASC